MDEYDISDYTYNELRQAFASIDHVKYPERVIKLYSRIIEIEKENTAQNKGNKPVYDNLFQRLMYGIGAFFHDLYTSPGNTGGLFSMEARADHADHIEKLELVKLILEGRSKQTDKL